MNHDVSLSEIEFVPISPQRGLVGFVSFVIDQKYYVTSIAVYTRLSRPGFRLVYPSKKVGEININTFRPIDAYVGQTIEETVSEKVTEIFSQISNEKYERRKS
jgi:hypothetical protein